MDLFNFYNMTKIKTKPKNGAVESILDLNANNIWNLEPNMIKTLWESEGDTESFLLCEDKLLNVIRLAYDVVHYNPKNPREQAIYENGEWATFLHCNVSKGWVAIRKRYITKLSDLSYENVSHISEATLLELIDRNFGGGWDSISLAVRDIILTCFDVSTTTLPATRLHMTGGTLDKKVAQGFQVLEIPKGTWIEAIFVKKKEPVTKIRLSDDRYDEEGNLLKSPMRAFDEDSEGDQDEDFDDENLPEENIDDDDDDVSISDEQMDDTFYSSYSEEAKIEDDEELEGLSLDGED